MGEHDITGRLTFYPIGGSAFCCESWPVERKTEQDSDYTRKEKEAWGLGMKRNG